MIAVIKFFQDAVNVPTYVSVVIRHLLLRFVPFQ